MYCTKVSPKIVIFTVLIYLPPTCAYSITILIILMCLGVTLLVTAWGRDHNCYIRLPIATSGYQPDEERAGRSGYVCWDVSALFYRPVGHA